MAVHIKRISDPISISNTVYNSIDTATYTNVDVIKTTAFALAGVGTTGVDGMTRYYNKDSVELTEVTQANIDLVASVGKYYWHTDKTLWIIVAKGAYADITTARTGLGTSSILYQLLTPVVTQLAPQTFEIYEGGTVYVTPVGDSAESTLPTVELTVPIAGGNKVGIATHDYAGAAVDWVLTSNESKCKSLSVTNAGGTANIIAPDKPGLTFTIKNQSGQAITIKKSGGTGVVVTNGKKVTVQHFGTNYEAITTEI